MFGLHGIGRARAAAGSPGELLERIGYGQYQKNLEDGGCTSLAQLQFLTPEVLMQCKVKPVHATHMFARLKESLGLPPANKDPESGEINPVRVYICCSVPPAITSVDVHEMMCGIELLFDAVWVDPRLSQTHAEGGVKPGDPVAARHFWQPMFGCAGMHKMQFEAVRTVYLEPKAGVVRTQYRATGQCPLASATDAGYIGIKLKLRVTRFTDDWVELWHPRTADVGCHINDGWSRLTEYDWSNELGQRFLPPTDFTEENILCPEYRLCNRHSFSERKQDARGSFLHVDQCVGFQVLTSTYTKEIEECLNQLGRQKKADFSFSLKSCSLPDGSNRGARDELVKSVTNDLSFLDLDDFEDARQFFRQHYMGKVFKAIENKTCAKGMAEQLIDLQKEVEQGNADQREWNECPVDPELAKSREKEERDKLIKLKLPQLLGLARRVGIHERKIEEANDVDGKHAEVTRLILRAKGVMGNRRRSATHGWCQALADNTQATPNFSVFQLTIRLQRLEEYYFLNPDLINQPQGVEDSYAALKLDTRLHVWVQSTVHSLKDIDPAASSVSITMHTVAFWRDRRLRQALMHRRVLDPERVWYPPLDVTHKETLEVSLLRLELISADNGLVRADYLLDGRCVSNLHLFMHTTV
jgi:hypothetical protein